MFAPETAIPIGAGLTVPQIAAALNGAGVTGATLRDLEIAAIFNALDRCHGNRTHAAAMLGISVRTLQRKLRALEQPYREPERHSL
jgi:DNA-binding NtrC family response regulator